MIASRDAALEQAFNQFDITKKKLTEELRRSQKSENELKSAYEDMQAEFYVATKKLDEL